MRVVVTGATGNIGTSTLRALALDSAVDEVVGIARRRPRFETPKCQFVRADVTVDDLATIFRGADAVIHLAWLIQPVRDAQGLHEVNVDGTRRVLEAVSAASVPSVVIASSVGAYSAGPKDRLSGEEWPLGGVPSSLYSMQKVTVERMLDRFEREQPQIRVVRVRPALVFKAGAAAEIRRLFIGPLLPKVLFQPDSIPFVPDVERLRFQCVHSHDVGRAFVLSALSDVRGAINLAADPVLDPEVLSETLQARRVQLPAGVMRNAVAAAWHLRLTPADRGWVDLALAVPLMATERARTELGWQPQVRSTDTLLELMDGLRRGTGMATVPLHP